MKIRHSEPYDRLRREAYPEVGEQLDAIAKLAAALREQGVPLPEETSRWLDRCLSVKKKYPKPD